MRTTPQHARSRPPLADRWFNFQRRFAPYLFISPFYILFAVFGLFPTLFSLYLAFHNWRAGTGLGSMTWNGIENFTFNLTDPYFKTALVNTLWLMFGAGLPTQLIALPLAFLIHLGLRRWQTVVTSVYFMPFITSSVAIALIFSSLLSRDFGLLNQILLGLNHVPLLGLLIPDQPIDWLRRAESIKPAVALVVVWRYVGWNTVLFLSALQAIPRDLYEAASVDGATPSQQFWRITLPLLRPMIFFTVTLTIIGQMQLFDEPFVLAGADGGPGQAGLTVAMYLYNTAFRYSEMGTAAAMAWILFAIIAVLSVLNNLFFGREARASAD